MKYIKHLTITVVFLMMFGGLLLNFKDSFFTRSSLAQETVKPTPRKVFWSAADSLPPEIMYRFLFEEVALLDEEDKRQKSKTAFKTSFYEDRLGLKPSLFSAFDSVVYEYLEKSRPMDARAKQIIGEYRAQFPKGELPKPLPMSESDQKKPSSVRFPAAFAALPAPPAELIELQLQKNKLVLELKDKIRKSLGEAEFSKFEGALKKDAESMIVPESEHKPEPLQP